MKRLSGLAFLGLLVACSSGLAACGSGDDSLATLPDAGGDASNDSSADVSLDAASAEGSLKEAEAASAPIDSGPADVGEESDGSNPCAEAGVPPSTLECAGLYADFASQTLSPNAQPYAPAVPLWSDGATKERWIELPPGQTIDVSNPNEWVFPIGTKLFKQFTYEGKRVETRMFQKTAVNFWVRATYAWNAEATATAISFGATVPVDADGGTWVIPTNDDCDTCHRGRTDRILGFEQVSLGLDGATGLTLLQLVVQGLVTPPPTQVNLRIGDDGTGLDAPALSWLHINCGVTCHNTNEDSDGYGAKMFLRLDPSLLDGSPVNSSWDPLLTTVNVPCVSGSIVGKPRIVPGNPSASVIVQLTSERGPLQMPPIASRFVDTTDVAAVATWIQHMVAGDGGAQSSADATLADAGEGDDDTGILATLTPEGGGGAISDASNPADDGGATSDAQGSGEDAGLE
jgi:hypothetical protein